MSDRFKFKYPLMVEFSIYFKTIRVMKCAKSKINVKISKYYVH